MNFTKMHGTGNDFVVIDGTRERRDWSKTAPSLCDRHFGVGADGVLVVEPSKVAQFRMRMFNPDGSEAEMCGNGIRCFAKYVLDERLAPTGNGTLRIETLAGIHEVTARTGQRGVVAVRVGMGKPRLKPAEIPVAVTGEGPVKSYPIHTGEKEIPVTCVSMGNPHAVAFINTPVAAWPLETLGPQVEHHPLFPRRVNFEIVNVVSRSHLTMRVWERGAGITLACGSGACAVAVAARLHGFIDGSVDIDLPGGTLLVEWDGSGEVWLEGPAELVFKGAWMNGPA